MEGDHTVLCSHLSSNFSFTQSLWSFGELVVSSQLNLLILGFNVLCSGHQPAAQYFDIFDAKRAGNEAWKF